jgi:hypothetical protein
MSIIYIMTDVNKDLEFPYYNNTSYPLSVKRQLESIEYTDDDKKKLKYHQFIVKELFTRSKNRRGLLICHGMGQGKTRLAASIADHYRRTDKKRKIIVLLPKSLESNFRNTAREYSGEDDNYSYISLNSSNMYKHISNSKKTKTQKDYEEQLGDITYSLIKDDSLNNSLLIIDEAHNLFNAITNGAKNAVMLYDLIMNSFNLKLIFLTGTPIINDPFELVPCFNMLSGNILDKLPDEITGSAESDSMLLHGKTIRMIGSSEDSEEEIAEDLQIEDTNSEENTLLEDKQEENDEEQDKDKDKDKDDEHNTSMRPKSKKKRNTRSNKSLEEFNKNNKSKKSKPHTSLFSEDIEEFENYFVNRETKTIKNKDKFTNRIYGLVSYYGDIYFDEEKNKEGFPTKLKTIVEKISMSRTQYARYISARNNELEETKRAYRPKGARFSSASGGNSTYRVKTRQISNYCIPEYALGPVISSYKSREKFINKIKKEDLINLKEYSPKIKKMIENITAQMKNEKTRGPGIIYSQFVSGEGISIIAAILKALGYTDFAEYQINKFNDSDDDLDGIPIVKTKKFAILSGDVLPEDRAAIIEKYNKPENKDGSSIALLLLSGAVAEGIDLKRVRHVHITEPFWNYARINQVETRAIRFGSHSDLPEDMRTVQVYIYLSDYPADEKKTHEPTTDVELYQKSINNMKIINTFMMALAEASIDCSLHVPNLSDNIRKNINCKLCAPTNKMLFHPIIKKDMTLPSNCVPYSEKKIKVQEIMLDDTGEKYYYQITPSKNILLYLFNKKLKGYTPMPRSHPYFADLNKKIIAEDLIK